MKIQVLIAAVISSFILYGCEDNETNYLELSESSFSNVDGDGATLTVSVTSDVEWQISKTAQWCNVTPGKGSGNQTLTLQIEANPDSKERKVTVTVASPATKMSRKIEITQAAGYTPIEQYLSLIHISEPTRQAEISYAVFCLKKKKKEKRIHAAVYS